jgi:ubiquinone/menaquinone biosynthesis C-methylase UbiE
MNTSDTLNQHYLLNEQYKDSSNFNTRLHMIQQLSVRPVDWYPWIFNVIKKQPESRVLELGCGPGYLWQKNLAQIPQKWDITLSDFSPGMLKEAHHNLSNSGRHFTFQLVDAQEIPFEDAHFDLVIANLMLYHVPDLPRALTEIQRVLKPSGRFYAATITEKAFSGVDRLMRAAGIKSWTDILSFNLENGAEKLQPWFPRVELQKLPIPVIVQQVEPLVTFIRSSVPQDEYDPASFERLRTVIGQELAQQGEIHIDMDIGIFEASRDAG